MEAQFYTQAHQMYLEGTSYEKPTDDEVLIEALNHKYGAFNIDIFYDSMQNFWRYYADISIID